MRIMILIQLLFLHAVYYASSILCCINSHSYSTKALNQHNSNTKAQFNSKKIYMIYNKLRLLELH